MRKTIFSLSLLMGTFAVAGLSLDNCDSQNLFSNLLLDDVFGLAQAEITNGLEPKHYEKHECSLPMDDGSTLSDPYWTCEPEGIREICVPVESMCQYYND